jgi:hypothetical protein
MWNSDSSYGLTTYRVVFMDKSPWAEGYCNVNDTSYRPTTDRMKATRSLLAQLKQGSPKAWLQSSNNTREVYTQADIELLERRTA